MNKYLSNVQDSKPRKHLSPSVSDQCDWPETVDCRYNAASVSADYRAKHSDARIFLTFDDGPNNGTEIVLNALRRQVRMYLPASHKNFF